MSITPPLAFGVVVTSVVVGNISLSVDLPNNSLGGWLQWIRKNVDWMLWMAQQSCTITTTWWIM